MRMRMSRLSSLLTILSLALASSPASASDDSKACPLWLAPSYLSTYGDQGTMKYGIYAGQTYEPNATLPMADLVIPMIDFFVDANRKTATGKEILETLDPLMWMQNELGTFGEGADAPGVIPGVGSLGNYHASFSNAKLLQASVLLRETGDEYPKAGESSPLRGAVTPYFNATFQVTKTIPAGMEIFLDHGMEEVNGNYYQDRIYKGDYELADQLLDKLLELYEKHSDMSLDMQEDIMEFFFQRVFTNVAGSLAKTVTSLIPENPRKLRKVKDAGGTFMYRFRDVIRSEEWLEEYGVCLDTIRMGVSKIPNAGRGAFANRKIEEGENVILTPLLHIADKYLLESEKGEQLITNYVFGHPESDMVFLPTAPHVTLINHGGANANAHLEWPGVDDQFQNADYIFNSHDVDLADVAGHAIVMKVVADRAIAEGEEITIDYGSSWQAAWDEWEATWKEERKGKPHPLMADDLKKMYKNKPLETEETLETNPYPENISVGCYLVTKDLEDGQAMIHQTHATEINDFKAPNAPEEFDAHWLYHVIVLDREESEESFYEYTVRASLGPGVNEFADVVNVPHQACTFFNREHTSDIFIDGAFRHHIGLPDKMVPSMWRH